MSFEEGEELSKSFSVPFLETSAKSVVNVEETFKTMSKEIRGKMENRGNRSYSLYTSANSKDMKPGKSLFTADLTYADGKTESHDIKLGDLKMLDLGVGETVKAKLTPAKGCDLGWGPGKTVEKDLHGGVVGLILDGRGRPIVLDPEDPNRVDMIRRWTDALNAYPEAEAVPA